MIFKDTYVSGPFLLKLYYALQKSRQLVRSDVYSEPFPDDLGEFDVDLFVLLLQLEDMVNN